MSTELWKTLVFLLSQMSGAELSYRSPSSSSLLPLSPDSSKEEALWIQRLSRLGVNRPYFGGDGDDPCSLKSACSCRWCSAGLTSLSCPANCLAFHALLTAKVFYFLCTVGLHISESLWLSPQWKPGKCSSFEIRSVLSPPTQMGLSIHFFCSNPTL